MAPSLGVGNACSVTTEEAVYLKPNQWAVSLSYRYLNSFRDFHGSDEVPLSSPLYYPGPNSLLLYANTHVNTWVIGITYAVTTRLNLTLEIPIQYGTRASYYEHDGLHLHTMRAAGLGDLRLIANFWLLNPEMPPDENISSETGKQVEGYSSPPKYRDRNISLGIGVKAPTGNDAATDFSFRPTGPILRPVDPAIQLGDGGWGVLFDTQGFTKIVGNSFGYLQASYLMNPRELNGTETPFGDDPAQTGGLTGYKFDTVPDQYLARAGLGYVIWPKAGLSVSLGARLEGVPVRDLVGGSDGYRIPGYAVSIEPGLSLSKRRFSASVTVPVPLERHASTSVTDARTGSPLGGYAAFADYLVTASFSVSF
jgi:hypothetical protein